MEYYCIENELLLFNQSKFKNIIIFHLVWEETWIHFSCVYIWTCSGGHLDTKRDGLLFSREHSMTCKPHWNKLKKCPSWKSFQLFEGAGAMPCFGLLTNKIRLNLLNDVCDHLAKVFFVCFSICERSTRGREGVSSHVIWEVKWMG